MYKKSPTFEFCISFENTEKLTSDILNVLEANLIILSPNEKSLGFSDLLEELFDTCEAYLQDAEFRHENSEVEVKNAVKKFSYSSNLAIGILYKLLNNNLKY